MKDGKIGHETITERSPPSLRVQATSETHYDQPPRVTYQSDLAGIADLAGVETVMTRSKLVYGVYQPQDVALWNVNVTEGL